MSDRRWTINSTVAALALLVSSAGHCGDSDAASRAKSQGRLASRPAPVIYATENYWLTFRVPRGSFYCPLPPDWVGSDHGTVIFLESPGACAGSGYASSERGFERDVARIEIYYGNDFAAEDGEPSLPKRCDVVGHVRFLGRNGPICRTADHGKIVLSAAAKYEAWSAAEAAFSLVTTADRFDDDLAKFRALLVSTARCQPESSDAKSGTSFPAAGPRPCPSAAAWF